ncbi:MAG: CocE/NonD family hydrolase [Polyangiales bacterium]
MSVHPSSHPSSLSLPTSTLPPQRRTTLGWSVRASLAPGKWGVPRVLAMALAALVLVLATPAERNARAAALLLRLAGDAPSWTSVVTNDFSIESLEIPSEVDGKTSKPRDVRARLYRAKGSLRAPRGLVLVHGVHFLGIDEPRLVSLARNFAQAGVTVLTPELEALADYRVDDPSNLDALRASVRWLARDPGVRSGGVGLLGVSFAGGLSLRVASEPGLTPDLAFVASIGGHNDMARVAKFFVTDKVATPEGEIEWKAHDYGLAVLVYNAPERFVSKDDAPLLRAAVRAFLHESYGEAAQIALQMSPQGAELYDRIAHRDRHALAEAVLRELPSMKPTMDAASPAATMGSIRVPVYILHGAHDDVVPPSESRWSGLEATGSPEVKVLVSARIGHAEMGKEPAVMESVKLVSWMASLLD